jgi:hypothetical protein
MIIEKSNKILSTVSHDPGFAHAIVLVGGHLELDDFWGYPHGLDTSKWILKF